MLGRAAGNASGMSPASRCRARTRLSSAVPGCPLLVPGLPLDRRRGWLDVATSTTATPAARLPGDHHQGHLRAVSAGEAVDRHLVAIQAARPDAPQLQMRRTLAGKRPESVVRVDPALPHDMNISRTFVVRQATRSRRECSGLRNPVLAIPIKLTRSVVIMPPRYTPSVATGRAMRTLGQNLRIARLRRRLQTATVAERAFISRETLRKIERGDPGVSMSLN